MFSSWNWHISQECINREVLHSLVLSILLPQIMSSTIYTAVTEPRTCLAHCFSTATLLNGMGAILEIDLPSLGAIGEAGRHHKVNSCRCALVFIDYQRRLVSIFLREAHPWHTYISGFASLSLSAAFIFLHPIAAHSLSHLIRPPSIDTFTKRDTLAHQCGLFVARNRPLAHSLWLFLRH